MSEGATAIAISTIMRSSARGLGASQKVFWTDTGVRSMSTAPKWSCVACDYGPPLQGDQTADTSGLDRWPTAPVCWSTR